MHCLTDFKNFALAELDLFKPLTVLLGRNGSGKTNLIEGVELLATLACGAPFNEITDVDRGGRFEVRGGLRSCIRFGREKLGLRFNKALVRFDGKSRPVDYFIEIAPRGRNDVQLSAERLQIGDRVLFDAMNSGGELMEVRYDNFSRGRNPTCQVSASHSVLSRYEEIVRNSQANSLGLRASTGTVQFVRGYLRNSYIFDPQPKAMREYARAESNPQLLRGGANLSAVLFALSEGDEERQAALQRITEVVRQIPEEPFIKIGFADTSLGDVMAGFVADEGKETSGGKLIDARLLSDGTLRMLAIVTALETVPDSSRIVIEEFDNGLHPSRAKLLVRTLSETASRRKLNVLVTTHNPAFMDALEQSQMDSVLICHGDEPGKGSQVTRLGDMDIAGTIGLRGGLGDFVTPRCTRRASCSGFCGKSLQGNAEMDRVAVLSGAAILDTSWLLELYRVPGYFKESRTLPVRTETTELIGAKCELFVTVPVLFEVASHITHVRDGSRRRTLGERLRDDVTSSIHRESPWTIHHRRAEYSVPV